MLYSELKWKFRGFFKDIPRPHNLFSALRNLLHELYVQCTLMLANQARLQMYATEVRKPRFESRWSHEKEP